jgi:lipopolysaccharide biosynthesis regulator YciM
LAAAYAVHADIELLQALGDLDPSDPAQSQRVVDHLQRNGNLPAAQQVLTLPLDRWEAATPTRLHDVVAAAARPLQRYRCAACGFEAQQYFWQCPGCQSWDSFPPRRGRWYGRLPPRGPRNRVSDEQDV